MSWIKKIWKVVKEVEAIWGIVEDYENRLLDLEMRVAALENNPPQG